MQRDFIPSSHKQQPSVLSLFIMATALIFVCSLLFGGVTTRANTSVDTNITIGFIGDSLTYGAQATNPATDAAPLKATDYLGPNFTAINKGINGQTTANWANNNCSRGPSTCLADAISAFQQANVDVVHIMLGTNDVTTTRRVSPITYYNNLQHIINQLKAAGFKRVVLARPIYFSPQHNTNRDQQSLNTLADGYYQALQALVLKNHGYVLMGDTQAYEWFKNHYDFTGTAGTYYDDPTHPTSLGYDKLGEFWAAEIKTTLLTKTTPTKAYCKTIVGFRCSDAGF
ncbi:MAG TPA: SGNH/GDSL hydrolase family protein [Candidatus Saccharimonadales bacterium]